MKNEVSVIVIVAMFLVFIYMVSTKFDEFGGSLKLGPLNLEVFGKNSPTFFSTDTLELA